jgi:trimeric autotransporter adhesin
VAGDTVAVGAPGADGTAMAGASPGDGGAVLVFVRQQDSWSQAARLEPSNPGSGDQFGFAVAAWNDAIVVGASREDSAAKDSAGDQASDAAVDAGAAYLFHNTGRAWTQQLYLKANDADAHDHFGYSVAIDAGTIVAGAMGWDPNDAAVYTDDTFARAKGAAYVIR